jgi:hypothetical protein
MPKKVEMRIKGLAWPVQDLTASGMPSVDMPILKKLAGDVAKKKYGEIYTFYKA